MPDRIPLLTETDAATYLGWTVHALRLRRFRGQEPQYLKLGRSVRYERETIDAFIIRSRVNVRKEG
jgi:hypothetical protein